MADRRLEPTHSAAAVLGRASLFRLLAVRLGQRTGGSTLVAVPIN
jgi:hypothetical protein